MNYFKERILSPEKFKSLRDKVVKIRREIHSYPEPGFEENRTSALIVKELEKLGISYRTGIAKTGVMGIIEGKSPGPAIALRADMDALSLQEETGASYASKRPGFMHACGHDGHVAILLGAATLLMEREFSGTIKLIFQPAEEGPGGADLMIKEGVLEDPPVKAALATHLNSSRKVGEIGVTTGLTHAATDEIYIALRGEGGHAARPHEGKDTIVMAAEAIIALQRIISRQKDPLEPVVLTIGTIKGGSRYNILADKVELTGTLRSLSMNTREHVQKLIKSTLEGVTGMWGGSFELKFEKSYPSVMCDGRVAEVVAKTAKRILGEENVNSNCPLTMGGEDFAFFTQKVPGVMFRLGGGGPDYKYTIHHPKFDFDEDALVVGSVLMTECALEILKEDWL